MLEQRRERRQILGGCTGHPTNTIRAANRLRRRLKLACHDSFSTFEI